MQSLPHYSTVFNYCSKKHAAIFSKVVCQNRKRERERDEKLKLFITMQMQKRVVKMAAREKEEREV